MTPSRAAFAALPNNRLLAEFSLWSADLVRLADDIARSEPHADIFHIDVSDGHFSPAFLFFPDQVAAMRKRTTKPLHVHLMVMDSILDEQIRQFAAAGSDIISIHVENSDVPRRLDLIASLGVLTGLVLQVDTPVAAAAPNVAGLAMLTLLGTRIGVKGQDLDPTATARLIEARKLAPRGKTILAADGGIREHTVPLLRKAGADTVVMGSLAFGAPDLAARLAWAHGLPGPA